jgi:hypothetical protein
MVEDQPMASEAEMVKTPVNKFNIYGVKRYDGGQPIWVPSLSHGSCFVLCLKKYDGTPALGRLCQGGFKFEARLDHIERPCLQKQSNKNQKRYNIPLICTTFMFYVSVKNNQKYKKVKL